MKSKQHHQSHTQRPMMSAQKNAARRKTLFLSLNFSRSRCAALPALPFLMLPPRFSLGGGLSHSAWLGPPWGQLRMSPGGGEGVHHLELPGLGSQPLCGSRPRGHRHAGRPAPAGAVGGRAPPGKRRGAEDLFSPECRTTWGRGGRGTAMPFPRVKTVRDRMRPEICLSAISGGGRRGGHGVGFCFFFFPPCRPDSGLVVLCSRGHRKASKGVVFVVPVLACLHATFSKCSSCRFPFMCILSRSR